jgi:hypothetical protein
MGWRARSRIGVAGVSAILLLGVLSIQPASRAYAASSYIKLTVSASPAAAAMGAPVTVTGTATPVGGTWTNVTVVLGASGGAGPGQSVKQTFATLSTPMTVTMDTFQQGIGPGTGGGGMAVGFGILTCTPDCLYTNANSTVKLPTATPTLSVSPARVVPPGTVLHITAIGSVNAGPVPINLHTMLPASGLADPTNLSAGVLGSTGTYTYIDCAVTLNKSAQYSFDTQVTAPLGATLKISLKIFSSQNLLFNENVTKTVTIQVGIPSTKPPPTIAPRGTSVATLPPTGSAPPALSPSPLLSLSPTSSASPDSVVSAAPGDTIDSSLDPSPSPSVAADPTGGNGSEQGPTPTGPVIVAGVVALGAGSAVIGLGLLRWRRPAG